MSVSDNTIFVDDFKSVVEQHLKENPECRQKREFDLRAGESIMCRHCGQVWRKTSAIRDFYRERDVQRQ